MLLAHVLDPLRWSIGGPHADSGEHTEGSLQCPLFGGQRKNVLASRISEFYPQRPSARPTGGKYVMFRPSALGQRNEAGRPAHEVGGTSYGLVISRQTSREQHGRIRGAPQGE